MVAFDENRARFLFDDVATQYVGLRCENVNRVDRLLGQPKPSPCVSQEIHDGGRLIPFVEGCFVVNHIPKFIEYRVINW